MLLFWVVLAAPLTFQAPKTPFEARQLLRALHDGSHADDGFGCATPQALLAQNLLQAENPTRSVLADVQIKGTVSEYNAPHFVIHYTKDNNEDRPPTDDTVTPFALPDGEQEATAQDGTPDYVEKVAQYMEYSRKRYVELGFKVPDSIEVRILNVSPSYSLPLVGISMSSHASEYHLPFLCAHEFFHQVEMQYFPAGAFVESIVRLANQGAYDTFILEGTAQVGAALVMQMNRGELNVDVGEYLANTDVDFWDQSYNSGIFWMYMMQTLSPVPDARVLVRLWKERGGFFGDTPAALEATAKAFGSNTQSVVDAFRVAVAVKGHFTADPTVPGPQRLFDFKDDSVGNWPQVTLKATIKLAEGINQVHPGEIKEDGGTHYYSIVRDHADDFVLRVTAASDDVRTQIISVINDTPRRVLVETFDSKDGQTTRTVKTPANTLATYVALSSNDGSQPYDLAVNPSDKPPKLHVNAFGCSGALGTPPDGRDTAAAIQMCFLLAISLLAARRYRQRRDP